MMGLSNVTEVISYGAGKSNMVIKEENSAISHSLATMATPQEICNSKKIFVMAVQTLSKSLFQNLMLDPKVKEMFLVITCKLKLIITILEVRSWKKILLSLKD